MRVRKINTAKRRDVHQFIDFPFDLYRENDQWVLPLVSDARRALNRDEHLFFQHSTADLFVAKGDGQTLGRIGAMDNRNYNDHQQASVAFFGFFDVVEDVEVAQALFDAAFGWARARGLDRMVGPRGLIGIDSGGVLVEGFEHRPAIGVTWYKRHRNYRRAV